MFTPKEPFECLTKAAVISIPVDTEIVKFDLVDKMGLGIWYTDSEIPSIILLFDTAEDAINCWKGFKRNKLKCKMKVIKGKGEGNGENNTGRP
jgi:hypothetical protein